MGVWSDTNKRMSRRQHVKLVDDMVESMVEKGAIKKCDAALAKRIGREVYVK